MTLIPRILLALTVAFVPSLAYVLLVSWLDRHEREPVRLLIVTFIWGAVPAVMLSVAVEYLLERPIAGNISLLFPELDAVSMAAAVVEELAKGVALLVLYLVARAEFDSVLDGIVYGAVIGFGFAMTENTFYFLEAFQSDVRAQWTAIIVVRSLLFGFNHAFYTAITGAGFGLAAVTQSQLRRWRWLFPAGALLLAVAFHAVHNLGIALSSSSRLALVITLLANWGGVALLVIIVLLAWRQEQRWIATELAAEVGDTLTPAEYQASSSYGRRLGVWLRGLGEGEWQQARRRSYHHRLITELAFAKRRARVLGDSPALQAQVEHLRRRVRETRP